MNTKIDFEINNILIGFDSIGEYLCMSKYKVTKLRLQYSAYFKEVDRYGNGSTPVTTKPIMNYLMFKKFGGNANV